MTALCNHPVDLVLLDRNLPDMHGLEIARALRTAGSGTDVLAVTSVRDIAMVRQAVALGVTHYLLKPFTFAAFRDKLDRYARYRTQLQQAGEVAAQHEIDRVFATLRGSQGSLPKGLDAHTLDRVLVSLRSSAPAGLSAAEVGTRTGMSRVTAPLSGTPGGHRPGDAGAAPRWPGAPRGRISPVVNRAGSVRV
jgi:response regulator of citrate/malate metabolism